MDLPIFLHEIDVQSINCVRFIIPPCFAGDHEDIEVTIEYGIGPDKSASVHYNAWARKGSSSVKFFVFTNASPMSGDAVETIMADLNDNPDFQEAMEKFINFIEKR